MSEAWFGTPITTAARAERLKPIPLQPFNFTGLNKRVVRVEGRVERVSDEESDTYFNSRPLDSRLGAWASPQSEVISSRAVLVANAAKAATRFGLHPPRPPHWGGYRLVPEAWEFWQGRKSRLHDRLRYRLQDGQWVRDRLAP
jgi:pyridoxamine 5'-phosphate oxidase